MRSRPPLGRTLTIAATGLLTLVPAARGQRQPVLKQITVPHNYYYREMYLPQLTTGPGWAAWSPDGTELVYSMGGSLWRQSLNGTVATELTAPPGYDYQPDWSPNGRFLVYSSYRGDAVSLRLLDLSTGAETPLVNDGAVNVEPRWSPDGSKVAYVSTSYAGRWHVFVVGFADGRAVGEPVRITTDHDSELPRYYYDRYDHFLSPTWSPDGNELILVSNAGRIWGSGGFWRMEARPGAAARQIWYEETTWKGRPDWAPDGKRVVYSSYLGRQWNQLWLMTAQGGDPFQLTYGEWDNTNPRWSRDGSRIAYISNQAGNTSLRVVDLLGGQSREIVALSRRYKAPRAALTVRIATAGRPTAARVSVTSADGRGWAPNDSWAHADDGFDRAERPFELTYFHSKGVSRLDLPAGRYVVEVTKGLEYGRQVDTVTVGARPTSHTVSLSRLLNLPATGWWSGDLHVHMNYGGHYRNTPANLRFQAEAEDLHVVENLIVNKEARIPDVAYFTGRLDPVSTKSTLIKHDQEYHTSYWGHAGLLGLTRNVLLPAYSAYTNTAAASLFPANSALFRLTRSDGGLSGYVHPFESVPDFGKGEKTNHAFPVDLGLGLLDYLEVVGFSDHLATEAIWHKALNAGLRLPAGAGTDAMANFASLRGPVGMGRVFVKAGTLDHGRWLAGLKAGRTMVTNGPLLQFTLEGREPGDEVRLAAPTRLTARLTMRSIVPVDSVEIVANGIVVRSVPTSAAGTRADLMLPIEATRSGWYTARAYSRRARHPVLDVYPFATTSPIYVTIGGAPIRSPADASYFVQWLDQLAATTRASEAWNRDAEREQVLADIDRARTVFADLAR